MNFIVFKKEMKIIIFTHMRYFNVNIINIIERNKNNILMHLLLFQMLQIMITTIYQK